MDPEAASGVFAATLADTIALLEAVRAGGAGSVVAAAAAVGGALASGGTLLLFGNGGSAADAQHVAAELVGRFRRPRGALSAVALTTDTSVLTSVANDFGYAQVFARQIEALGRRADVALGITTSGASGNVLAGIEAARVRGLRTIALTGGDGGPVGRAADIHVNVPSPTAARVQEVQRTLLHVICDLVEQALA